MKYALLTCDERNLEWTWVEHRSVWCVVIPEHVAQHDTHENYSIVAWHSTKNKANSSNIHMSGTTVHSVHSKNDRTNIQ